MARQPNPPEVRTVKALRDAKAITAAEQDAALLALAATEPCEKCGGDGAEPAIDPVTDNEGS